MILRGMPRSLRVLGSGKRLEVLLNYLSRRGFVIESMDLSLLEGLMASI